MPRSSAPVEAVPLWKRIRLWHVLVAAAALLPVILLPLLRGAPEPSAAEREVLRSLEPYGARHEVDDSGRVVGLVLEGKQVTDQALDPIPRLPHLKSLSLHDSSVTDAGLLKLRDVKRLQALGVTNTQVTDRGLGYLSQMPSLRYVWVCETDRLTRRGIDSLRRALPGVQVYVMGGPAKEAHSKPASAGR